MPVLPRFFVYQPYMSAKHSGSLKAQIARRTRALAALSALAMAVSVPFSWHWIAELFSHFVPYYAAVFGLAAAFAAGKQRLWWAAWFVLSAAWLVQPHPQPVPAEPAAYRLLWYNVNLGNLQPETEAAHIRTLAPDFVALAEPDLSQPAWQALHREYPHGCQHSEDSPFSLVFWAKRPLSGCHIAFIDGIPYIRADLADGSRIFALHPPPPITAELAATRQKYLDAVAADIAAAGRAVVVGDLNSSPFSPVFRRFVQQAGLLPETRGLLPTWKPFFIHIDHVLGKNETVSAQAQPWFFSDHRAILVTLYRTQVFRQPESRYNAASRSPSKRTSP